VTLSQKTVAGALNNEKRKSVSAVSLERQMTMKTVLSSFPAKQLQWWRSPDRRRQAVPGACSRYREGAVAKCDASCWRRTRPKAPTCIYVSGLVEGLSKIRWCSTIKAAVNQNTKPKLDPLRKLQPVQFTEEWGCVFRPPRREHQACGGIHDRL